jgi:hypothetical protein
MPHIDLSVLFQQAKHSRYKSYGNIVWLEDLTIYGKS